LEAPIISRLWGVDDGVRVEFICGLVKLWPEFLILTKVWDVEGSKE
jgi:hypothetical protein